MNSSSHLAILSFLTGWAFSGEAKAMFVFISILLGTAGYSIRAGSSFLLAEHVPTGLLQRISIIRARVERRSHDIGRFSSGSGLICFVLQLAGRQMSRAENDAMSKAPTLPPPPPQPLIN
jgi:hypothetical protein